MAALPDKSNWVSVKTILPVRPFQPASTRPTVTTDRLIIRALAAEDLQALHMLRTQPEVMAKNPQGRIDKDLEETRPRLAQYIPPHDDDTYSFAICDKATGEMIGMGGCYRLVSMLGWPAIGFLIRREYWGQGIMTEFIHAWLDIWRKLPREEAEIDVDPRTLPDGAGAGGAPVLEQLTSWTASDNIASQRVLEKGGFEHFKTWKEPDLQNPEVEIELLGFRYFPSKHSAT